MTHADAIIEAVDFMESSLDQEIFVETVAASVGYSLYHFSRLFQGITGSSPGAYLNARRLTEAANELATMRSGECNIVDVAFKYQFGSHEAFTRAFKRKFGLCPSDVRELTSFRHLPYTNRITPQDVAHRTKGDFLEAEVVELDSFCVVGLATIVEDSTTIIPELWRRFGEQVNQILNRRSPEKWYEIAFWTENLENWSSMAAVEVSCLSQVPSTFVAKVLPASRYARFVHKGQSSQVGLTWKYIYETWLPRTKHVLSHPFAFEYYGPNYRGPHSDDSESEIYVPIG